MSSESPSRTINWSKGELLFEIDPSDYQLAVEKAKVSLDQSREDVEALEAALRAAEATYFQETKLRHIKPGDRAIITLMSHPDEPLEGVVDTIGNATNPPNVASTEGELGVVPQIQPTFDWIRLAQRVSVTIRLTNVPENVQLISGTTASISIED